MRGRGYDDARLVSYEVLGQNAVTDLKAHGYGCPVHASFTSGGDNHDIVVRTMRSDHHGHDRRSDRVGSLALCMDTFNGLPQHVHALDFGAFDESGRMVSMPGGEPFLVTDYAPGHLYAKDLVRLAGVERASSTDLRRAQALASYLAELHAVAGPPMAYRRAIRDTVGAGEGIFGLIDTFPDTRGVPQERQERFEQAVCRWRWRLRRFEGRCRRTHGDFHPFNLLFDEDDALHVLDCSRGAIGEPADDTTCLSINYIFFALVHRGRFEGALRALWEEFWKCYLDRTEDRAMLGLVAPFFAWRALVLASPAWYPDISDAVRQTILMFAERLLEGATFDPRAVEELLL